MRLGLLAQERLVVVAEREIERRAAVGVLRLEVGAVLDEELDERVEAVLRGAVQRGLVRDARGLGI